MRNQNSKAIELHPCFSLTIRRASNRYCRKLSPDDDDEDAGDDCDAAALSDDDDVRFDVGVDWAEGRPRRNDSEEG